MSKVRSSDEPDGGVSKSANLAEKSQLTYVLSVGDVGSGDLLATGGGG